MPRDWSPVMKERVRQFIARQWDCQTFKRNYSTPDRALVKKGAVTLELTHEHWVAGAPVKVLKQINGEVV